MIVGTRQATTKEDAMKLYRKYSEAEIAMKDGEKLSNYAPEALKIPKNLGGKDPQKNRAFLPKISAQSLQQMKMLKIH